MTTNQKHHHAPLLHCGFTLVEMVMVIVLLGILAAVGAPMIANGMRIATTAETDLGTLSQLRYTTERLARELREVRLNGAAYDIGAASLPLTFTRTDGTIVALSQSGSNLNISYNGGASTVLSNQVNALALGYTNVTGTVALTSPSYIDVSVTLTNGTTGATYNQRTRVALRSISST